MRFSTRLVVFLAFSLAGVGEAQDFGFGEVGSWNDDPGDYADVWGEGDLAVMGKWGFPRVLLFDIGDPTTPTLIGRYEVPPPNDEASAQDVKTHGGLMFVALEGDENAGAQIVDIRDPANPRHLVDITVNEDVHNLFYAEGWLYLTDRGGRLIIVDLRDFDADAPPAEIATPAWHITIDGAQTVHDITVQDDRLYVSGWNALYIYDVSNIASEPPRFLGSGAGSSTHSSWATDDGRFVVVAEERNGGGIKLYEIAPDGDGVSVTLRDEYAIANRIAHNPLMVGERVFCSWYSMGCLAFRIDRAAGRFELIARHDTGSAWGVYPFLGLDRILTSNFTDGLVILSFCEADLDSDGDIDADDFFSYLDFFAAGDLLADINGDGRIDSDDFFGYLDGFVEGC